MKSIKSLVILGILMVAAVPAFSQTATATVNVSANVTKVCTWTVVNDMDFGAYDPFTASPAGDKTASAVLNFRCTKSRAGQTVAVDFTTDSTLTNSADATQNLSYTVLNGAAALADYTFASASSAIQTLTLNGTLAGGQDVADGTYADTIRIDLNY